MIDSTEPSVIEAALKIYAGRPIVNSINLENGRDEDRRQSCRWFAKRCGASLH